MESVVNQTSNRPQLTSRTGWCWCCSASSASLVAYAKAAEKVLKRNSRRSLVVPSLDQPSPSWRSRSAASVSVRTGVPGTRSTGCRFHSSVIRAPHALETESRRSLIRAGRRCHVGRVMDRSAVVQPSRERVQLPRVLFVEDERELGELLELLLDRGLPAIEGLDLLGRLRSRGVTARALVLTARGSVGDRVAGLDAGADDYLTKPFAVEELLARLRALLRRHQDGASRLDLGSRSLDLASRTVEGGPGAPVELTEREAALLATLARRPGRTFTREELLDLVFGGADGPAVVDTYVHYLRRKLGRGTVRTVRGTGYRMGTPA